MRRILEKMPKATKTMWNFHKKSMDLRDFLFRPLGKFFSFLHISPNMLSYFGVIMILFFAFFLRHNPYLAFVFFLLNIFADISDGVVARYKKIDSDKGKFIDVTCDNLSYTIFIIGIFYARLMNGLGAIVLVYFMLFSRVMRAIHNGFYFKSDWHFKPISGVVPYAIVALTYLFFVIYFFTSANYLKKGWIIFACVLILDSFYFYYQITKHKKP